MDRSEALQRLLEHVAVMSPEEVPLSEAAGRVSAETLASPRDIPATYQSRVDGFCLRSWDTRDARPETPLSFPVACTIRPEDCPAALPQGNCARVYTGSPLPPGADTCVRQEDVIKQGNTIVVQNPVAERERVLEPGSELPRGTPLATRGLRIHPYQVGLLAMAGHGRLRCFQLPRVALVATGDEIGHPGEPGKKPASNLYQLFAYLGWMGARPLIAGLVEDSLEALASTIAVTRSDLTITLGGTGPGDRDVVGRAMEILSADSLFKGVSMKPGRHTETYLLSDKPLLALSGPPPAALAGFGAFVRPAVLKMMGLGFKSPPAKARFRGNLPPSRGETLLQIAFGESREWVQPCGPGDIPQGLVVIPPGEPAIYGGIYQVLPLDRGDLS